MKRSFQQLDGSISAKAWQNFKELKSHIALSAEVENKADDIVDKVIRKSTKIASEQISATKPFRIFVVHNYVEAVTLQVFELFHFR